MYTSTCRLYLFSPLCTCLSPPFLRHCAATVLSTSYECMQSGFITISPWRNAWCTREQTTLCFLFWSLRPPGCSHRQAFFFYEFVSSSAQTGQPVDATVCLWGEEYKKGRQPQTAKVMAMASARTQLDSSFHSGWTSPGSSQAFTQFWTEHRV